MIDLTASPDRVVFSSPLVMMGMFRCPTIHPKFSDSGPTGNYSFVFPRTSLWIRHDDEPAFVADPTVVTMYNPEQHYTRGLLSADGDRSDWFAVAPSLLREVLTIYDAASADCDNRLFRFSHAPSDAETYKLQRLLLRYVRDTSGAEALFVEEAVMTLLSRTLGNAYAARGVGRRPPLRQATLVERARAFLNEHYTEGSSLGDIARAAGCSPFHLCRVFRDRTGFTLHAYRNQLRLRHALEPVCEESKGLIDIAIELGYVSHSHFTHAFRRTFGVTPSTLRCAGQGFDQRRSVSPP